MIRKFKILAGKRQGEVVTERDLIATKFDSKGRVTFVRLRSKVDPWRLLKMRWVRAKDVK